MKSIFVLFFVLFISISSNAREVTCESTLSIRNSRTYSYTEKDTAIRIVKQSSRLDEKQKRLVLQLLSRSDTEAYSLPDLGLIGLYLTIVNKQCESLWGDYTDSSSFQ